MTTLPENYWDGPHDCSLTRHLECSQSQRLPRNQTSTTREETRPVTELAHRQPPTGPIVWVLSTGEDHEGGTVLGVYASKDAAKGPFVEAAKRIPFDLDSAWQNEESGAVHAHGGCDWVALEPHPLITSAQLA